VDLTSSSETTWSRQKRAAFGPTLPENLTQAVGLVETDLPFASLLEHARTPPIYTQQQQQHSDGEQQHCDSNTCEQAKTADNINSSSTESHSLVSSDFVMVELKAPFAGQEDELGRFYRDCQMAPTLSMFEQTCSLQEMLGSITDQLVQFEANADEFNEFVNSLQQLD
jgi:autophagy-related protein 13